MILHRLYFSASFVVALGAAAASLQAQPIAIQTFPAKGIEYEPLPAIFAVAPRGVVTEQSIQIINKRAEPLQITGMENPNEDRFTARVDPIEDGRRYRLVVSVPGEGPVGHKQDILLLKTNWEDQPVLKIPVNTKVREKIYTFPESLFMGRYPISELRSGPAAAKSKAQILMIYRKQTSDFEVKASSDIPFLKIDSEQGPDGDRWENTVWFDPETAVPGPIDGKIVFETNDPRTPRLEVAVTGALLDQ